ncbi:MAG: hypothetical protein EBY32_19400 [Proteobacteria bacterium]|nr:hypothetical protein [Pseudomonadota bacterium]
MKQLLSLVLTVAALSSAAAAPPPGAVAAWDPANSEPRGDSIAILDAIGTNALLFGPNSGCSIVDDPKGGGKKVLNFQGVEGEPGVGISAPKPFVVEADWCIRLRVMPLDGGVKVQTLLDMIRIEMRYDASKEKLSLNASGGGTLTVSLLRDQWSEVVASLKGKELTFRVGEETATLEIPESGLFDNLKLPFRLGSRGAQGGRPFTGMVSDISFGEPE